MDNLIPQVPFVQMPDFMLLLVLAAAIWILMRGADTLVEGAAGLAYKMGIPKVIVGATIVSLGTTMPEATVSVMAAWEGKADLALGNAVGSIIADTGLIFGLGCVLTVLPADRFVLTRQGWLKIATGTLLAALCYGAWIISGPAAQLDTGVGLLLLLCLAAYLYVSVKWSRQHPQGEQFVVVEADGKVDQDAVSAVIADGDLGERSTWVLSIMIPIGLAVVVFSSRFVIASVTELAERWHVPNDVVAVTLVAFGTSLPELVVGMTAIYKGHKELLVGNVIGADILNVLFVIGASAVAAPLLIVPNFLYLHLPAMMVMMMLFLAYILFAVRSGHFRRWFGVPLLGLYGAYVVICLVVAKN